MPGCCCTPPNLCPAPGDSENNLLAKILTSLNNGGGGGGAGVSSISVNGGAAMTGAVSLTIPDALLNFTDENANADGVVWSSAGTVETFRTVGATNNVQFGGPDQRIHSTADTDRFSLLGSFNKATGSFLEVAGQSHASLASAIIGVHDGGAFSVTSAPINSTVGAIRFSVAGTTGDVTVSLGRTLLPNTTSAALGGIYFGGTRFVHNFGTNNVFTGSGTGNFTLTGTNNTGIGNGVFASLTTGSLNTAVGSASMAGTTTGTLNTALGVSTLQSNVGGSNNTAFGYATLFSNVSGGENIGIGFNALFTNTGDNNTAIGSQALLTNAGASGSVAIGRAALILSTGATNIAIGLNAGDNVTTGANNIVIGTNIDSPTATNSNTLTIGNLIFGTGLTATGTTISTGSIGIGVINPVSVFQVVGTSTFNNITQTLAALFSVTSGANTRAGNATLVAGTVTVNNTSVTANTIVLLTRKTSGGTIGTAVTYTVTAATSFTITSDSALDTSTFSYFLLENP